MALTLLPLLATPSSASSQDGTVQGDVRLTPGTCLAAAGYLLSDLSSKLAAAEVAVDGRKGLMAAMRGETEGIAGKHM